MIFKLVLIGFKLKKVECWAKKMAHPVQPVVLVWSRTGWGRPKSFSLSQWPSLPGQGWTSIGWGPVEVRSRFGWGPVEAQRSLFITASLAFFFYKKSPIFIVSRAWPSQIILDYIWALEECFWVHHCFITHIFSAPFNPSFSCITWA